ncbi:hypothetical protein CHINAEXTREME_07965 [Halobiforma lacisalsi AJ5]|uniref:Uncharacterized protein n=1 Tax=Natronobacterium lacisalsi AJ5 TaxID=358396 RepID=M0LYY5_NATLA|nr:hypothetical protein CHINAEXTREME_07965 [Halobiforma lacisalsi AJ5]EMA37544.1 hypothetical protein C445_01616 [Halobiforma lacisalsi AJ5]
MRLDARRENGQRVIEGWNRVFEALAAEPRRQLVVSLLDASPDATVPLPESAVNPNVPTDPEVLRRELHHQHLPMLADGGFVEWDADPLVAARGPNFDQVAAVIESLQASATSVPDSLVIGCQRLEAERQEVFADRTPGVEGERRRDGRSAPVGDGPGDRSRARDRRIGIGHRTGSGVGLWVRPSLTPRPRNEQSSPRREPADRAGSQASAGGRARDDSSPCCPSVSMRRPSTAGRYVESDE